MKLSDAEAVLKDIVDDPEVRLVILGRHEDRVELEGNFTLEQLRAIMRVLEGGSADPAEIPQIHLLPSRFRFLSPAPI